jgi:glycosyltransferase involved in cell wall biosynthesis
VASDDVLLVHASIGNEPLHRWIMSRPERLIIRYHNITPAAYFRSFDVHFAHALDAGRHQLAELVARAEAAIADSEYNADELRALGMPEDAIHVVPPLFPFDGFAAKALPPDVRPWPTPYDGTPGGVAPRVLFVGQLLPHKRPDLLVSAYHVLVTHLDPRTQLRVIGPSRLERFGPAVRRMADDLRLPIDFAGAVSQETLEQSYRDAHVMLTLSEHEGFCVPVVEAMAIGLPVVARRFAALPETLGDAALLLDAADDPLVIAEAVHAVFSDPALRTTLARRGLDRAATFAPARSAQRLLAALDAVL